MTYRKVRGRQARVSRNSRRTSPASSNCARRSKKNNTPAGFALGHASGDANAWLHWILWGHGAYTVDKDDKVIINSPETVKALEYCQAACPTPSFPASRPGMTGSNNKAFLAGELYCTANGISIYVAAKDDPTKKELAEDTYHALWPVGPIGKPTELQLAVPILAFNFTKYPNAAKALVAFMLEKENYDKWLSGARGYLTHTLNAYDVCAGVDRRPEERTVFSQASKRALPASGHRHARREGGDRDRRLPGGRHVRQLLHRPRGCQGRDGGSRTAVQAHLSLTDAGRAASDCRPPLQTRCGRSSGP